MNNFLKFAFVLYAIVVVAAYPRGATEVKDNEEEASARLERQAGGHHHDVVDFGAHTGHKGSFGWYADFPVLTHH